MKKLFFVVVIIMAVGLVSNLIAQNNYCSPADSAVIAMVQSNEISTWEKAYMLSILESDDFKDSADWEEVAKARDILIKKLNGKNPEMDSTFLKLSNLYDIPDKNLGGAIQNDLYYIIKNDEENLPQKYNFTLRIFVKEWIRLSKEKSYIFDHGFRLNFIRTRFSGNNLSLFYSIIDTMWRDVWDLNEFHEWNDYIIENLPGVAVPGFCQFDGWWLTNEVFDEGASEQDTICFKESLENLQKRAIQSGINQRNISACVSTIDRWDLLSRYDWYQPMATQATEILVKEYPEAIIEMWENITENFPNGNDILVRAAQALPDK